MRNPKAWINKEICLAAAILVSISIGYTSGTGKTLGPPIAIESVALDNEQSRGGEKGDPGWMRKMASRRAARARSVSREVSLADLGFQRDKLRVPVLLIGRTESSGTFSRAEFQEYLFGEDNPNSMTAYYNEVSNGQFYVNGDVHGWYKYNEVTGYTPGGEIDNKDLVINTCLLADPQVDFSLYDNDGPDGVPNSGDDDGYVDVVYIVGAGRPVNGGFVNWLNKREYTTNDLGFSGGFIKINTHSLIAELAATAEGSPKRKMNIGTFDHELGHVLGLPDLYDRDGSSLGLGRWCLMSMSHDPRDDSSLPAHMSAWCKVQLGWVSLIDISEEGSWLIQPVENDSLAYRLWEDGYGLSRYFLLETRNKTGFDSVLPLSAPGLLIYHVDEGRGSGLYGELNNDETHKLVDLEEAEGQADLDRGMLFMERLDPFPGPTGNRTFDDFSNPNSRDYHGNSTGVAVTGITVDGTGVRAELTPRKPVGYAIAYDPNGLTGYGWTPENPGTMVWGGVMFKATQAGLLAAVDVAFITDGVGYEIKIYRTLTDSVPMGFLARVTGNAGSPVWQTVDLHSKGIWLEKNQEIFVAYGTSDWITVDVYSENIGRSYFSANGIYFSRLLEEDYGNFNLRLRVNTENVIKCDFDGDGNAESADVISLLKFLRDNPGDSGADFNRDGAANVTDAVAMLLAIRYGACPE